MGHDIVEIKTSSFPLHKLFYSMTLPNALLLYHMTLLSLMWDHIFY